MISTFTCNLVGYDSLGSDYSRYMQKTLTLATGEVVPSGARINSVTFRCSNITVWSSNAPTNAHHRLDGVDFMVAQWEPRGQNQNLVRSCYTTDSIYVGKAAFTYFAGWDSSNLISSSAWCSYRSGGVLTLTIDWDGKSSATLTSSTVDAGTAVGVNITRASADYTHKVTYTLGTHSTWHSAVTTYDSFTIPLDWCDQMPNTTVGYGSVTVETFSGGTSLGSVSLALTVNVPASVVPTAGTLNLGATGLLDSEYFVQGKTSLTPFMTGSAGIYGSSIVGYQFSHSGLLQVSGSVSITGTVTDSRGRTAQATQTVTVYAYQNPTQVCEVFRCDADGNRDDSGTNVWVKTTATGTPIPSAGSNHNPMTIINDYRETGGSWTGNRFLTSGVGVILPGPFATNKSYDIRIIVHEQAGGEAVYVCKIQTAGYLMYLQKDGTGVAFGKACEHSKALEVPADWDIYKGNTIIGGVDMNLVYPVGSIYMSVNGTNPGTLFGVGTWERIEDVFLMAAGSNAAGSTGGEETHTLTESEMPIHTHDFRRQQWFAADTVINPNPNSIYSWRNGYTGTSVSYSGSVSNVGGGQPHNNMPPYLAVYVWKRSA